MSDRNLFSGLFFAALIALAAATGCSSSASKAAPTGDTGGDTDVEVAGGDADAEAPIIVGGSIQPGVGVTLEDKEIKLGDTYAKLKETFGEAINKRDLTSDTSRFKIRGMPIFGFLAGTGDQAVVASVTVFAGFTGTTADNIGIGAARADVDAAYAGGQAELFTGGLRHAASGMTFGWEADKVSQINIGKPW